MRKIAFPILLLCLSLLVQCSSRQVNNTDIAQQLKLITSIPLPHVSGRIDHLTFDRQHQLVFIAALGNNSVEVVDLKNQQVIHSIKQLNEPQGILFIPGNNTLLVANSGNGVCDVFNANTYQKIASIDLEDDADNVRYDSTAQRIYIGYAAGGIAIIDAKSFEIIAKIKLSGHPESFQLDTAANRIYINVPSKHQIEVIDLAKEVVIAQWKISEAQSNFPMSLDATHHRLFVGCRHSAKMLIINTQTGKTISSLAIDRDADDIFYDPTSQQIYVSCGGGYIDVIHQTDANNYQAIGTIASHTGARTSLLLPELHRLLVAAPAGFRSDAQLLVYEVNNQ